MTATWSGLKPAPDSRFRWAYHHLSYSFTTFHDESFHHYFVRLRRTSNFPLNTSCTTLDNQVLLSSDVTFNLDYPESLFAASVFLFALGCSGFTVAQILKKCGARLHDVDETMPPSEEHVAHAKKWHNTLLAVSALSLVTSRIAAVYATTTISMAMTLRKVPNILEDFSINSEKNVVYNIASSNPIYPQRQ